jgi:tetratricopeptide (TPR) repeat protein
MSLLYNCVWWLFWNLQQNWYNKGLVDKVERRLKEAVQCYDKALEIDPKYVQAWYGKGGALNVMGGVWLRGSRPEKSACASLSRSRAPVL